VLAEAELQMVAYVSRNHGMRRNWSRYTCVKMRSRMTSLMLLFPSLGRAYFASKSWRERLLFKLKWVEFIEVGLKVLSPPRVALTIMTTVRTLS
jgi:hypothetical protein